MPFPRTTLLSGFRNVAGSSAQINLVHDCTILSTANLSFNFKFNVDFDYLGIIFVDDGSYFVRRLRLNKQRSWSGVSHAVDKFELRPDGSRYRVDIGV